MPLPDIQIFWIRHAHSCGNAKDFSNAGPVYKAMFLQTRNPQLSNIGLMQIDQVQQHRELNDFLSTQMDLVCSSDMIRSLETALRLFPDRRIKVVPFVNELTRFELARTLDLDIENKPQRKDTTISRLDSMGYQVRRLDWSWYVPSTPNFVHFIRDIVMDKILHGITAVKRAESKPFRVAIVTHGKWIKRMMDVYTKTPSSVWNEKPYFTPLHCHDTKYKSTEKGVGNVAIFTCLWSRSDLEGFLRKKLKLPRVFTVYETSGFYDSKTGKCIEYDGKRFIDRTKGAKHHVLRCDEWIREISTLKDLENQH